MKPSELYAMEPERVDRDVSVLFGCHYCHVPEIRDLDPLDCARNERVEIRYLKDFSFDGRRIWRLATVWFEGVPVMIIQNAGREGDDFRRRFVTDAGLYMRMIGYLATLVSVGEPFENENADVVGADDEVEGLTSFYGQALTDRFEPWH